jgi:outer membrane protein assembly factor BamB
VFVKPNDSPDLMALDAASGALLWRRALPSRIVHLLGEQGSDLYVSGDHLWSVEPATGEIQWRFGFDDPAAYGYGRGAIAGRRVFWTTHDDLFVIDRLTGKAVQRYPLRELIGISGGHVLLAENRLVIAGPDHLTAFALAPADD